MLEKTVTKIPRKIVTEKSKKRVAAYARVSSDKDAAINSLETQISYFRNLIASHNDWDFVEIYYDEGISGTLENRPGFCRLLDDCRAGKIDLVLAKSITRFARNTVVLLDTIRELKDLNVDVCFEKEQIHTMSGGGELLLTLLASYAQEEARSASENQRWRARMKFKKGQPWSSKTYGYRIGKDGKLEVIPEEAEIVRKIFRDYLSGIGTNAIANNLTKEQVPTKYGGKWRDGSINKILRNENYIGKLILQKTFKKDYISKQSIPNVGQLPKYIVEDAHEPIIDKSTFYAVQDELERRGKFMSRNTSNRYPFSGLIRCGCCGGHFRRKTSSWKKKHYWICETFNLRGKEYCSESKQIPEHVLIEKVCEVLGVDSLEDVILSNYISSITAVYPDKIIFDFIDGSHKTILWSISRKDSWTPEMKEMVRQRELRKWEEKHGDC